jgi:DNA helicase HerA-like ATPase
MTDDFAKAMAEGYAFEGPALTLGAPLRDGAVVEGVPVRVPLAMLNRHGLIAGATGTGKTRTLQLLTDQLSAAGVPVFVADLKGDLSGLAAPGGASPKVEERARAAGVPFTPAPCPAEFLSLTGANGIPLRATVSSFGPLLLARALELNETQKSVLTLVFRFCDDQGLLLLDLPDLKEALTYLSGEGKEHLREYGGIAPATVGVLLRKMIELEQQGGGAFLGEPSFDVEDLLRVDDRGHGVVSILELSDIQDRPDLFSTFMMWLLASLFRELPEAGDLPRPKLVFFFDEAHLLFEGADREFLEQVQHTVRLIRSKGVGVFFVTQTPKDLPADVLGQLGNRIQHALRAFTPDDDAKLKATANTFPRSPFYDIAKTIPSLGIGEALITVLTPRGTPSPVAATRLVPPTSLMGPIPAEEIARRVAASPLHGEYAEAVDRESAREVLQKRVEEEGRDHAPPRRARGGSRRSASDAPGAGETVAKILNSPTARAVGRELARGLLGVLGVRATSRRRRRY